MALHRLTSGDLALVVDDSTGVPSVVHWGPDPGPTRPDALRSVRARPGVPAGLDVEAPLSLVPQAALGFPGRAGIELTTPDGPAFPRFDVESVHTSSAALRFRSVDRDGRLALDGEITLADGVGSLRLSVVNTGLVPVTVHRLAVTLPLPADTDEILRFDGRWVGEFQVVRQPWPSGALVLENRRGRTSHDHVPALFAGPHGFGEHTGRVHAVHVAWSGNHEIRLERLADGRRYVQGGELLVPGEVVLAPGDRYDTPSVHATWGPGLTPASQAFHRLIRRTQPATPRKVLLNTWEAVYFDHDLDRLRALADVAASVGVERFVLDDGWFGGRRDDTAGLGDWWVSPDAHPGGLGPLIEHVTGLGMEFGIWVEPEMVNPDSDLYRAHPDWVLGPHDILSRHQLVLDLSIEGCWQHLFDHLHRLLADHDIGFVKWDHNRDLVASGAHDQTVALYRLLDALRAAHPMVEFESCASGGGRADAEILRRCCRIWTSDCNDAVERQVIQRGFSYVFPPEVMGAHIGPPRAHTTGRMQRLSFRAATALFGHLGIEWNLLDASERDLDRVRDVVALHKHLRPLVHGGDVVRLDHPDPGTIAHGVVATDRSEAVFALAQVDAATSTVPAPLVLAGLDPDATYQVRRIAVPGEQAGWGLGRPEWLDPNRSVEVSGRLLQTIGLQPPVMPPESVLLLHLASA